MASTMLLSGSVPGDKIAGTCNFRQCISFEQYLKMAKQRIPIPEGVATTLLVASDRTCCVCNIQGLAVQIHHIDENPSNNEFSNLAVLCFECHEKTQIQGGFGRRLNAAQVTKYQEQWLARVEARRSEADRLAAQARIEGGLTASSEAGEDKSSGQAMQIVWPQIPSRTGLRAFVMTLPILRRLAYEAARPGWESSVTVEMANAGYRVVDTLKTALVALARYYPYEHFGTEDPREYFSELIETRFRWHSHRHSIDGNGFSGTIIGPLSTTEVIADVERMIEEIVEVLVPSCEEGEGFSFAEWLEKWRSAGTPLDVYNNQA
jgi:hypothetical protein